MAGKPTPTQAENDRAALGEHIAEHEDDGSGPDPFAEANAVAQSQSHLGKQAEPKKPAPAAYQTRQAKPA
jgi:hypothetical protein